MQPTCWRWLCAVVLLAAAAPAAHAYTDPNNYNLLVAFRDSMNTRSKNWEGALNKWTCPTPPENSSPAGACDPCGNTYDGNWYHMHCRGKSQGWGESGDDTKDGLSTNMHITSSLVDGPVPKELCIIPTLREHDFGGQLNKGHLTGPLPWFLADCYKGLEELDLSNNRLTGTIPPYLSTIPKLSEIKFENNGLIGTIPPELGNIPRLRRFQTEFNNMNGRIPETFKNAAPYLTQFHIARNDYEGDLSMLAGGHLTTATVHDNPKLCGMVPSNVRFAKGYNPGNTNLGKPCPGTAGPPAEAAAATIATFAGETGAASGGTTGSGAGTGSLSVDALRTAAQAGPAVSAANGAQPAVNNTGSTPVQVENGTGENDAVTGNSDNAAGVPAGAVGK